MSEVLEGKLFRIIRFFKNKNNNYNKNPKYTEDKIKRIEEVLTEELINGLLYDQRLRERVINPLSKYYNILDRDAMENKTQGKEHSYQLEHLEKAFSELCSYIKEKNVKGENLGFAVHFTKYIILKEYQFNNKEPEELYDINSEIKGLESILKEIYDVDFPWIEEAVNGINKVRGSNAGGVKDNTLRRVFVNVLRNVLNKLTTQPKDNNGFKNNRDRTVKGGSYDKININNSLIDKSMTTYQGKNDPYNQVENYLGLEGFYSEYFYLL